MSAETDNISYTGLCKWDSCFECPHMHDCESSDYEEVEDEEPDD